MAESSGSVVVSNNLNIQKQCSVMQQINETDEKTETAMQPILLEDYLESKEPKSLQNLFAYFHLQNANISKTDILSGLVYIIMLEAGFVPSYYNDSTADWNFDYKRLLNLSLELPPDWKDINNYKFSFVLPPFHFYTVNVSAIVVQGDLLLNCVVRGVDQANFCVLLDLLTYFTTSNTQVTVNKLQNLKLLSRIVKNDICYPAKGAILRENNVRYDCLNDLPPELVYNILSYLKPVDLLHVSRTNKHLHDVVMQYRAFKKI